MQVQYGLGLYVPNVQADVRIRLTPPLFANVLNGEPITKTCKGISLTVLMYLSSLRGLINAYTEFCGLPFLGSQL